MRHLALFTVLISLGCVPSKQAVGEASADHGSAVISNQQGAEALNGATRNLKALDSVIALLTSRGGFRISERDLQGAVAGACEAGCFVDSSIGLVSWEYQCKTSPLRKIDAEFLPEAGRINQVLVYFDQAEFNRVAKSLETKWGAPEVRESEFVGWTFQAVNTLPEPDGAAVPAATLQIQGDPSRKMSVLALTVEPPEE